MIPEKIDLYSGDGVLDVWKKATRNEGFYTVEGDEKSCTKYVLDSGKMAAMRNGICIVAPYNAWLKILKLLDNDTRKDIEMLIDDASDLNGWWEYE